MVAAPAASKLALRELTCRFGTVTAVDRATLALARGEFVSLLGPSGCGKTTTLRMIAGFLDPTEGTIELDGRVISAPGRSLPPEKRERPGARSEEHTSELQSRGHLVCRLLLEKKKHTAHPT